MHQFDENHPEFRGFSQFYERELAPGLRDADADRQAVHKRGLILATVVVLLALMGAALAATQFGAMPFVTFLLIGGVVAAPIAYKLSVKSVSAATKQSLVGGVFGYVGWTLTPEVSEFDHTPWAQAHLLPRGANRRSFEDRVQGPAHGAQFQSVEAVLKRVSGSGKNRSEKLLFRGQLMWLTLPQPLGEGRTIVLRDRGKIPLIGNRQSLGDMKRVGLADPVFERLFEAYSTDQVGARVVLDPVFMQRLVDLEAALRGKSIRYAFYGTTVLIAVETPNLFEAGSMRTRLDAPERAQRILDEVGSVLDIADHLIARSARR